MKIDRLMGILATLMGRERVTACSLAQRFEVSRRTISRDIDALCRAGVPIVTRQGGGGGISVAEGYRLDKSVLTKDEMLSLTAALKGLGSVTEKARLEGMLAKLSAGNDAVLSLREPIVINLASHYQGSLTVKIEQIKRAILNRTMIEFDYYSDKGMSRRHVEPYLIAFQWTAWYVMGYCHDRQDWRTFKLTRLSALKACAEQFEPRQIPEGREDFDAFLTDENRMIALFHPSVKHRLVDSYGPDSFTEEGDGMLRLTAYYTNRAFIVEWLLSFGANARVLDPPDLALELRDTAQKMFERYS